MPEHDRDSLGVALADLADAMPADPYRVEAVHALVQRRRTRRRVRRSALGVAVAAATIAGLVLLQNRPTAVTTVPATAPAGPTTAAACGKVAGRSDSAKSVKPTQSRDSIAAEVAAKEAAAVKEAEAPGGHRAGNGQPGIKGYGTIEAVSDGSVTIRLDVPAADQPDQIVAAFTAETAFADHGADLAARPALAAGDHVVFGALARPTGYELLLLETNPVAPLYPAGTTATDAEKAAAAAAHADCLTPPGS